MTSRKLPTCCNHSHRQVLAPVTVPYAQVKAYIAMTHPISPDRTNNACCMDRSVTHCPTQMNTCLFDDLSPCHDDSDDDGLVDSNPVACYTIHVANQPDSCEFKMVHPFEGSSVNALGKKELNDYDNNWRVGVL
eukprot:GEMP01079427.1.p1 GENE.GEMP01079427.1~~GEMP01079427.1.p1  ORF type:complete len:134 (-),score=25.85 GEMP01079427.1:364-765(-)